MGVRSDTGSVSLPGIKEVLPEFFESNKNQAHVRKGTREPAGHRLRHPFPQRSRSLPGTYTSVFPLTVDLAPASRAPAPFPPPVTCKVPVPDAYEPSDRLGPVQPWGVGREFAGVRKVEDEDVEMVDAFACPAPVPWGAGASQNASPQKNATRQHTPQRAHEDLPAPVARPPVQIEEPLWPAYHDGDKWVLARTMGPRRGSQDELVSAPCTFDAGQDACRFQANRASDASLQGCRKQEPPAPANLSPQRRKSEHVFAAYHQAEPTGPPQSAQSARRTVSATASQRANPSEHVRVDSEGFVIPTIPPPSLPDVQAPWGSSLPAEYTGQTGDCKLEPPNTPTQLHATALPHFFPMYYPSVPLTHPLLAVPAPYTVHPCSKCIARFDDSSHLRFHEWRHATVPELPYPCMYPMCSRAYATTEGIARHVQHEHSGYTQWLSRRLTATEKATEVYAQLTRCSGC